MAGLLTASHGRCSERWQAASSRDALLFRLLGSVHLAERASGQNDTCGPCPGGWRRLGEDDIERDTSNPAVSEQTTRIVTHPLNEKDQDDRVRIALGLDERRLAPGGR
jgi:hypothetical protein